MTETVGHYTLRDHCLMCNHTELETLFSCDFTSVASLRFTVTPEIGLKLPWNLLACLQCQTIQTKYLGNLSIIYGNNHVDAFGSVKQSMIQAFSSFICENDNIHDMIEVGTPTADLAESILRKKPGYYSIIEPDFVGNATNIHVIKSFFEHADLSIIQGNTLILSHVFEHFYYPLPILEKLAKSNIQYIYLNHPDFEYYCRNNVYNILNIEHISYFELSFMIQLFGKYGFELKRKEGFENHAIFLEFIRGNPTEEVQIRNRNSLDDIKEYYKVMLSKINMLNTLLRDSKKKAYLWPASAHNITLLNMGLDSSLLTGLLDNSPLKIGKFLYGYKLPCLNFKEILESDDPDTLIIIGCSGNYIKELDLKNKKVEIMYL